MPIKWLRSDLLKLNSERFWTHADSIYQNTIIFRHCSWCCNIILSSKIFLFAIRKNDHSFVCGTKKWSQSRNLESTDGLDCDNFFENSKQFYPGRISFFRVSFLQAILKSKILNFQNFFFISRYSAGAKFFRIFSKIFYDSTLRFFMLPSVS